MSGTDSASAYSFQDLVVAAHAPFDLEQLSDQRRHHAGDWTIPEAYAGVLLAAAMADGMVSEQEASAYIALTRRSRALRGLSEKVLREAEAKVKQRAGANGNWLQEACQTLPADMCLPVFAHCADIALADGELLPQEAAFLESLAPMLDIPPEQARRVMEVLALKARY